MCSFNPYDSDTFPCGDFHNDNEFYDYPVDEEDNHLPIEPVEAPPLQFPTDSSEDSDEVVFATDPNESSMHMTDLTNIRSVIAALTSYPGGSLRQHLENVPGLIIMPLRNVSQLRKPTGHHKANPNVILYIPHGDPEDNPDMVNFNEAIRLLNQ